MKQESRVKQLSEALAESLKDPLGLKERGRKLLDSMAVESSRASGNVIGGMFDKEHQAAYRQAIADIYEILHDRQGEALAIFAMLEEGRRLRAGQTPATPKTVMGPLARPENE